MPHEIKVDLITEDPLSDEFVLYLVEDGPWPTREVDWKSRLSSIQNRILSAADVAIDGLLAFKYPDAAGKAVRIQVDSPSGTPVQVENLICALERFLREDASYAAAIKESAHIRNLRVVSGKQMGRFG